MCLCTLLYTTAFLGLFLLIAMGKHILVICVIPVIISILGVFCSQVIYSAPIPQILAR